MNSSNVLGYDAFSIGPSIKNRAQGGATKSTGLFVHSAVQSKVSQILSLKYRHHVCLAMAQFCASRWQVNAPKLHTACVAEWFAASFLIQPGLQG